MASRSGNGHNQEKLNQLSLDTFLVPWSRFEFIEKKKSNRYVKKQDAADRAYPESLPFSVHHIPSSATSLNASVALKTRTLALLIPTILSFRRHLIPVMQHQESSLPSIDEVTPSDKSDTSRLPCYRETRRYRFHPYERPLPVLVNDEDRLLVRFPIIVIFLCRHRLYFIQNTIYDDEYVVLNVPPLPAHRAVAVAVEFIHQFYSDLIFKPNFSSTHLCPTLLTNSKNVSAEIWNTSSHLNYAFNAFPQSLWSVFSASSSMFSWPSF